MSKTRQGPGVRLSYLSRNPEKNESASVAIANQTGGRLLTVRLEFNYKNESKLLRHEYKFWNCFLWTLLALCSIVVGFFSLSINAEIKSRMWLQPRHSTIVEETGHWTFVCQNEQLYIHFKCLQTDEKMVSKIVSFFWKWHPKRTGIQKYSFIW